jgi:hypothetical protein
MKTNIFLFLVLILTLSCHSTRHVFDQKSEITEIKRILYLQQTHWNRGDIDAFMNGYWRSEELTFIGSKGIKYGWSATLAQYKKSYPDKATMGQLNFEIITLELLGTDAARMIGKYTLTREKDMPSGHFTLFWRKIDKKWLIISDQTC